MIHTVLYANYYRISNLITIKINLLLGFSNIFVLYHDSTIRHFTTYIKVLDSLHLLEQFKVKFAYDIINHLIPVIRTSEPWFTDNLTHITNWTFVIT